MLAGIDFAISGNRRKSRQRCGAVQINCEVRRWLSYSFGILYRKMEAFTRTLERQLFHFAVICAAIVGW